MWPSEIETRLRKTRKDLDFLKHMKATVAHDECGKWRFIVDDINLYCSES